MEDWILGVACALTTCIFATTLHAQTSGRDTERPSTYPLPDLQFLDPNPPDVFVLPQIPEPEIVTPEAEPATLLKDVRFSGNTVIDTAILRNVAAPYVGRPVTAS